MRPPLPVENAFGHKSPTPVCRLAVIPLEAVFFFGFYHFESEKLLVSGNFLPDKICATGFQSKFPRPILGVLFPKQPVAANLPDDNHFAGVGNFAKTFVGAKKKRELFIALESFGHFAVVPFNPFCQCPFS